MSRQRRRARLILVLALCAAVAAAAAGVALSRVHPAAAPRSGSTAAPSAPQPGSAQTKADLTRMQALLNSGSVSQQAALLAPPMRFASGSKPIFPAGRSVTIKPGTLRPDGQFGTVQASLSGGKVVTLDLYSVQGHWHLIGVKAGSAQTRAAVTPRPGGQPVMRLMSATINTPPTWQQVQKRTPVIFVHGWMPGNPAVWGSDGQPDSMFAQVNWLHGTSVSAFDYSPTNGEWFGDNSNGPALAAYIRAVAKASKAGGGNGKVIIVAHSMGGLLTRYAANMTLDNHRVADDIGMVITLGTPNTGSFWADGIDKVRAVLCWEQTNNAQNFQLPTDFCRNWTALAGMSVLGPKIAQLQELPSSIPLFAIAGLEILHGRIGLAVVDVPLDGDAVVSLSSALHHRTGGGTSSYTKIQNPPRMYDISAWHGALPQNRDIIAMVRDLIRTYVAAHPAPVPVQAPAPAAPALGGDVFWLAGGGKWTVHGEQLQIEQGPEGPAGLVGALSWNAGGAVITGHAQIAFTSRSDGSLAGTYITSATYTYPSPLPAGLLLPSPGDGPQKGQSFILVPVSPGLAKSVPANGVGNPYICQLGIAPDLSRYCGA